MTIISCAYIWNEKISWIVFGMSINNRPSTINMPFRGFYKPVIKLWWSELFSSLKDKFWYLILIDIYNFQDLKILKDRFSMAQKSRIQWKTIYIDKRVNKTSIWMEKIWIKWFACFGCVWAKDVPSPKHP